MKQLLIIGHGMVAERLILRLVERSAPWRITVVGAEPVGGYNRVLLSARLAGDCDDAALALSAPGWREAAGVETICGRRVFALSPGRAHLDDGTVQRFDACVIATGSNPVRLPLPGVQLAGVTTFRTLADAEMLAAAGGRAVVIGGGLLGLETAYGLAKRGAAVTLVHLEDRLMERQLCAEGAACLRGHVEALGVRVLLGAHSAAFEGGSRVEALRLASGERLLCELAVMSVGVRPNVALARTAGLGVNRGIVVDGALLTAAPGVYALGECAEHRGQLWGLVEPLYAQADALAATLCGTRTECAPAQPATNLKVSGVSVFSSGAHLPVGGAEALTYRDAGAGVFRRLQILREGNRQRLVGAVLVGDKTGGPALHRVIASGEDIFTRRDALMFGEEFAAAA